MRLFIPVLLLAGCAGTIDTGLGESEWSPPKPQTCETGEVHALPLLLDSARVAGAVAGAGTPR